MRVDMMAIAAVIADASKLDGSARAIQSDRVVFCGWMRVGEVRVEIILARGLAGAQSAEARSICGRSALPRVVLMARHDSTAGELELAGVVTIPLAAVTRLADGRLMVDESLLQRAAAKARAADGGAPNVFQRRGDVWHVRFEGTDLEGVRHSAGLEYIGCLLAAPHRQMSAASLVAQRAGRDEREVRAIHDPVLDGQAVTQLKRRAIDFVERRNEAERNADPFAIAAVTEKIEALEQEVRRATGLGGRIRPHSMSTPRKSVSMAIERARTALGKKCEPLGRHLLTIRTGTDCVYEPDRPMDWVL